MIIPVFLLYIWQSSWLCAGCIYLPLWCFLNVHMELSGIAEVFSEVRIKQNLEKQQNFMNKHLTQNDFIGIYTIIKNTVLCMESRLGHLQQLKSLMGKTSIQRILSEYKLLHYHNFAQQAIALTKLCTIHHTNTTSQN